ncbi:MAG: GHKL domain-containing protein [Nitrospiraceae bacterium]|nr:MAG: GHKL domain-containing protein [Nitrospiraceae bacterium]
MIRKFSFTSDKNLVIRIKSSQAKHTARSLPVSINGENIKSIFPGLHKKVELVFRDGKERQIEKFRYSCMMGAKLSSSVHLVPVKDREGKVKDVSIAFDNISADCPLREKRSDSDEKMIEIGKIASSLAHGVRNPLSAIKGAVVYLSEKYGHETTLLEFSSIINDEISKLDTFISDFLCAAKGELQFVSARLDDILNKITVMIRPRVEIQGIAASYDFQGSSLINAEPFQLEQALFNIVNNALEAMPRGGTLKIKTSISRQKNKKYTLIEISDTGKGIPPEKLQKLGRLSAKDEKTDKGFGIYLSREIIKLHNGKLSWKSVSGKGTTFRIFLPIKTNLHM